MNILNDLSRINKLIFNKSNLYFLLLIIVIFTFDRITKNFIIKNFVEEIFYLNKFINLDLVWNIGIGFGLLSYDSVLAYNLITALIGLVVITLFYFTVISDNLDKLIFSIIIGGALGNLYDRLLYNAVPDFIDLHYNTFHWFTFNVADIFITLGVIIMVIREFFVKKNNE
ncbi:signal peptidase II [Pelagibacteraceae bacterium]|jgi:signal peptidase II|nr:signal peptidase II [Pelagibacteraceae bacterium]